MARKRRLQIVNDPTPAANEPINTAPTPTEGPTPPTNQHVPPPHPEPDNIDASTLAINNPTKKSKKKSEKYWTVDIRDARGVVKEGRVRSKDVISLPDGQTILMEWSRERQPVGEAAGLLGYFLGNIGNDFSKFPISYERWPDVPSDLKEQVWKDSIKRFFDVNESFHKHYILGAIGRRWRDSCKVAFDECYNSARTWEASLKIRPKGCTEAEWASFLTYRLKPETQKAAKNAANRAKQTIPHTLGTMTMARLKHRLETEDQRQYTRGDMYGISHKSNDGKFINDEAKKKSEELEKHRQANSSISDDGYIEVFGEEHSGYVRGMGYGPVPSQYFGSSSRSTASSSGGNNFSTREELDASNAKIKVLEEQVAMLMQQFALHSRGNQVSDTDAPTRGRPSSASHETRD